MKKILPFHILIIFSGLLLFFETTESARFHRQIDNLSTYRIRESDLCPDFDGDGNCETISIVDEGSALIVKKSGKNILKLGLLPDKEGDYSRFGLSYEGGKARLLFASTKPKESSVYGIQSELMIKLNPTKQEEQALKSFHADGRWQWIFYPYFRTMLLAGAYSIFLIGIIGAIFFSTKRGQQIDAADAATNRPHR